MRNTVLFVFVLMLPALSICTAAQSSRSAEIARLIRQNHLDEAEKELWTSLAAHPDQSWALRLLGTIRRRQNRPAEAVALLHRSLTLDPRDLQACRGLAEAYTTQKQFDKAIAGYSSCVKIAPADVESNAALTRLYEQAGNFEQSLEAAKQIPEVSRPPELLPVMASDYFGLKDPDKIGPLIAAVLHHKTTNLKAVLDFDVVLVRNGYVGDAERLLQAAAPAKPSADFFRAKSRLREAQGQRAEASALLVKALQLRPNSFDLLFDSARVAAEDNRWEDTVKFLREANKVQPDQPEVLLKLALASLKTRRRDAAVAVAHQLVAVQPDKPENEFLLASALVSTELYEQADPIARKLVQERPDDANNRLLLGTVLFNTGDVEGARQQLERCLELDPKILD